MTSKKLTGSPMTSLIAQWCHQQQPSPTPSYRILIQSTTGLATRLQAANSLSTFGKEKSAASQEEEEKVYRRAGLRTPSETAVRDLFGGPTWLVRILEIGAELEEDCHVVLVRTQTRDSFVPPELLSKITILDATQDPWGWDSSDEGEQEPTEISLRSLSGLFVAIRNSCRQRAETPVLLVWESLAPLFLVHGFDRTLRFLQAIDTPSRGQSEEEKGLRILQLWSVRRETLTASQHAKMEDTSNALLFSNRGEMTLMRQGVRETGNVVRERLPFRLVEQNRKGTDSVAHFSLEEQDEAPLTNNDQSEAPSLVDEKVPQQEGGNDGTGSVSQKPGRSRIQLRLESDDEVPASKKATAVPDNSANQHGPRIYLQDDDPEFDDMDEEDPDDDLDI